MTTNIDTVLVNLNERMEELNNKLIDQLYEKHNRFSDYLNELKYGGNPYFNDIIDDLILFVEKYLYWFENHHQYFWNMFKEAIWLDQHDVYGPLHHFISYGLIDDGGPWIVKWVKRERNKEVETTEDDFLDGYPKVVEYEYGSQNPRQFLDAMIKMEENLAKRAEHYKRMDDLEFGTQG